jgi:response regulator of citrate/malate metabolism
MENTLFCLIVEDEPLAQEVLENYINRLDQLKLVCKCESVEEAFDIISSQHIDVVFLDLNLGSISGIDLVKKVTQQMQKRYYLIITSSMLPDQIKSDTAFLPDNFILVDHLTKPFSFNQFLQSIKKVNQLE